MNTFVIYDEHGNIILTQMGNGDFPKSVGIATIEVPEGKEVDHVNTETGEVILKDKAKTEAERIADLEAQIAALAGSEV